MILLWQRLLRRACAHVNKASAFSSILPCEPRRQAGESLRWSQAANQRPASWAYLHAVTGAREVVAREGRRPLRNNPRRHGNGPCQGWRRGLWRIAEPFGALAPSHWPRAQAVGPRSSRNVGAEVFVAAEGWRPRPRATNAAQQPRSHAMYPKRSTTAITPNRKRGRRLQDAMLARQSNVSPQIVVPRSLIYVSLRIRKVQCGVRVAILDLVIWRGSANSQRRRFQATQQR